MKSVTAAMSNVFADFRYALRALRRQPTFVLIAVLTLTLGIGANTAIFSVVKAVLLNPLPYEDPDQIVVIWETNPEGGLDQVSTPTFLDWQRETRSLGILAAYRQADLSYAGGDEPRDVPALRATPELFDVLAARARVGRTFVADEAVVGADRVVVLSHGFWQRSLGGRDGVVDTTIVLAGEPYTIVGIMPPGFEFPTATRMELWTPLAFDPDDAHGASRRSRSLMVVGRMSPGATAVQTQQEMNVLADRIATEYASTNGGWGVRVVAAHEQLVSAARPALLVLTGAVGFLLLIVCANMANLLLARLSSRRREIAVRGALGAGRWALARPVLAESLILAVTGGALGAMLAVGGLRLLTTLPEGQLPRMDQIRLDGGVLLFTMGLSIAVAVVFGLLPALHASRAGLREQLTESTGATGGFAARRMLSGLVVAEVALALVLMVGAGLMGRSFSRLLEVSPGFDPDNVVAAQVMLPASKYPEGYQRVQFFEEVVDRLRGAPGVQSASAVSNLPMQSVGVTFVLPFNVEGQPPPENEDPRADVRLVTSGLFETMRIPLRRGRFLDARDTAESPRTAVINETMARRYFPDGDPIGQVIENPHGRAEVVGGCGGRALPGARQRAPEAGVRAAEPEPGQRNGAGGADRARPDELRRRAPARDLGGRCAATDLRPQHAGPVAGACRVPAASEHGAAVLVRVRRVAARGARYLRGAVLCSDAAHPGDRAPDGARRQDGADPRSGDREQHVLDRHRCRRRAPCRHAARPVDGGPAVRCQPVRRPGVRRGGGGAGGRRSRRQPDPGAPGHARGPHRRAARSVGV